MAFKGKMELTIGVSVGSSIQIAVGVIPVSRSDPIHRSNTDQYNPP